jgi:hypothetical protein
VTRSRPRRLRRNAWRARGQTMVEYIVVTAFAAMALFLPIVGNESVAEQLARAVGNFFRGLSFIVSVS